MRSGCPANPRGRRLFPGAAHEFEIPLVRGPARQGTLNGSASFACEEERGSFVKQDLPPLTVLATFNDRVSAEIACALLSDASIHSGEPEPAAAGTWLVSVRGVHPDLADRTEVVLKSAGVREVKVASAVCIRQETSVQHDFLDQV